VSWFESDYYAFMGFGGERSRDVLLHYVGFFTEAPVLELGSGQGEFLDLLRAAGLAARGVDADEGMVAKARAAGHEVVHSDALEHLRSVAAGSLGGVFAAHFLEHFGAGAAAQIVAEVGRVLRPGGTFVAVVPNAGSLSVLGYDFWRDPTHVRFYDPQLLAFLAWRAGMVVAELGGNPRNSPGPPPQLLPAEVPAEPPLGDEVHRVLQDSARVLDPDGGPGGPGGPGPGGGVAAWSTVTHLLRLLDERLQAVQHQNAVLRTAYTNLLDQLYPASEVYMVARLAREEDGS
jgi:SAM-dependent methyltransferase